MPAVQCDKPLCASYDERPSSTWLVTVHLVPVKLKLRFDDPELERSFRAYHLAQSLRPSRVALVIGAACYASFLLLDAAIAPEALHIAVAVRLGVVLPAVLLLVATRLSAVRQRLPQLIGAWINLAGLGVLAVALASTGPAHTLYVTGGMILCQLGMYVLFAMRLNTAMVSSGALLLGYVLVEGVWGDGESALRAAQLFFHVAAMVIGITGGWLFERRLRDTFLGQRELDRERAKVDALLRNVLPGVIADRLKANTGTIADGHEQVSVLFADLVGFTSLASQMRPDKLVKVLDHLFREFDKLAERYGVEKIKTIGDAYMVAAGLPLSRPDHAKALLYLALDMLDVVKWTNLESGRDLQVRIGIHSGPVVAGVIGQRRLQYDLWGDTVNLASRLESHGVPDAIQVSDATLALLGEGFAPEPRGTVQLKGRGDLQCWLFRDRTQAPPSPFEAAGAWKPESGAFARIAGLQRGDTLLP